MFDAVVILTDAAAGARTQDLRIKSPLLYQLSYGGENVMIAHLAVAGPGGGRCTSSRAS